MEERLPMQFTVELGYKVTELLGSNLGRPMWGCGMSGTHMPQRPARPFLTARRVCGPSSTLPRTPGQLPGPDLSRRILFSEKQAQRGMFLAERSAGKFDSSLTLPIQPSRRDWLVSDTHFISGGAFMSPSKESRVTDWW